MQAFDAPVMETNCEVAAVVDRGHAVADVDERRFLAEPGGRAGRSRATRTDAATCPRSSSPICRSVGTRRRRSGNLATAVAIRTRDGPRRSRRWRIGPARVGREARALPDERTGWVLAARRRRTSGRQSRLLPPSAAGPRRPMDRDRRGALGHGSENGDGVRGRVVSSSQRDRRRVDGASMARRRPTVEQIAVKAGRHDRLHHRLPGERDVGFVRLARRAHAEPQRRRRGRIRRSQEGFHGPRGDGARGGAGAAWCGPGSWPTRGCPAREELTSACDFLTKQRRLLAAASAAYRGWTIAPRSQALGESLPGAVELERVFVRRLTEFKHRLALPRRR